MLRIGSSSQQLSELQVPFRSLRWRTRGVRDIAQAICSWLETVAVINPAENRRGYLPYTRAKLKQHARTGERLPVDLVTELDPDAPLRTNGARLADEDESYETAFLRTLFEYMRLGDYESVRDMCRQSDQSWRAASLAGILSFTDGYGGAFACRALSLDLESTSHRRR